MDQLEAHQRAQEVFAGVLANVTDDQLDLPTPCTEWPVATLIAHVAGGNCRVVQLAGGVPPELPIERTAAHATSADAAQAVFAAPDGLTRPFELAFATLPGGAFIGIRTGDVLTHAWDLAMATGQPTDLDADLAAQALAAARQLLRPELRGPGRPFGAEQPSPSGGSEADRLAAFLGRPVP